MEFACKMRRYMSVQISTVYCRRNPANTARRYRMWTGEYSQSRSDSVLTAFLASRHTSHIAAGVNDREELSNCVNA